MSDRTRVGLGILGAAAALGVLGDLLLRETPWGLNWALWAAALILLGLALGARRRFALGLALLFSAALAWRASPALAALNVLASAGALALAAIPIVRVGVVGHLLATLRLGGDAAAGPVQVAIDDVDWKEVPSGGVRAQVPSIARGLLVAMPLVLVFGGLFIAADEVFGDLVGNAFDIGDPATHIAVFLLWAWIASGVIRHLVAERGSIDAKTPHTYGSTEVAIALGSLVALFLAFVIVQLRYLFGGNDRVLETAGLTYAEYARRGFLELVLVAALTLPVLLVGDAVAKSRRLFRGLALALVVLLGVVMASALQRMLLYTDAYGLTRLRLYATAFMVALALTFAWLVVTVLRERRTNFALGAIAIAFVTVAGLNVLNPDALIARVNIDRHVAGKPLDSIYLAQLSTDATPTILSRLDRVPANEAEFLRRALEPNDGGWRTWSWSRARARDAYDKSVRAANR